MPTPSLPRGSSTTPSPTSAAAAIAVARAGCIVSGRVMRPSSCDGLDRQHGIADVARQRGGQQQADERRGKGEIAQLDRRVVEHEAEQQQADRRRGGGHGEQQARAGVAMRCQRRTISASMPNSDETQRHGDGRAGDRRRRRAATRRTRWRPRNSREPRQRGDRFERRELAGAAVPLREEEPQIGWQPDREADDNRIRYRCEEAKPVDGLDPARQSQRRCARPCRLLRRSAPRNDSVKQRGAGHEHRQIVGERRRTEQHARRQHAGRRGACGQAAARRRPRSASAPAQSRARRRRYRQSHSSRRSAAPPAERNAQPTAQSPRPGPASRH